MALLTGLNNKVAVITGGSQGLGAATAHLFAARGAKGLVLCGRQTDKGLAVADEIQQQHPSCEVHFVTADLAEIDSPKNIIGAAQEHFGQLDILINVAGLSARGTILDTSPELYDRIMNINVRAPFFLIQEAAKLMRSTGADGAIVSIGSIAAYAGMPMLTAYCTSKGGLNTLTRNAAHALMRDRIRVNCLNIGWMSSDGEDVVQRKYHGAEDGWQEAIGAEMPFGRLVDPEEVARALAFLASDESGLMTGSIVNFDQSVWAASDAMVVPEQRLPD
ncbi:SDR family oxidoreductase [Candidatus Njordibacter sp. Uisw_039]|jgi:NAD(P)-dependent dehydrogenase (short-subunit alcohol dehydrogenase family)|uniref:SDR family oxidoreductase n=1 Tax=Candidatus Njordibacter sp. Uisw_039 TaxID=3230972 RepID=UPI003D46052F